MPMSRQTGEDVLRCSGLFIHVDRLPGREAPASPPMFSPAPQRPCTGVRRLDPAPERRPVVGRVTEEADSAIRRVAARGVAERTIEERDEAVVLADGVHRGEDLALEVSGVGDRPGGRRLRARRRLRIAATVRCGRPREREEDGEDRSKTTHALTIGTSPARLQSAKWRIFALADGKVLRQKNVVVPPDGDEHDDEAHPRDYLLLRAGASTGWRI